MDIARDICTDSFYIVNSGLPCIAVTAVLAKTKPICHFGQNLPPLLLFSVNFHHILSFALLVKNMRNYECSSYHCEEYEEL